MQSTSPPRAGAEPRHDPNRRSGRLVLQVRLAGCSVAAGAARPWCRQRPRLLWQLCRVDCGKRARCHQLSCNTAATDRGAVTRRPPRRIPISPALWLFRPGTMHADGPGTTQPRRPRGRRQQGAGGPARHAEHAAGRTDPGPSDRDPARGRCQGCVGSGTDRFRRSQRDRPRGRHSRGCTGAGTAGGTRNRAGPRRHSRREADGAPSCAWRHAGRGRAIRGRAEAA